jgi:uncharacterized membrane protein
MAENKDDDSHESVDPEIEDDSEESSLRRRRTTAELTVKQSFEFSGPLPPPQLLKGYNDAFPGCAERVVAMAERQSAHRQQLEKAVVESNCNARGQWFAFILALVVIGGGVYLLAEGKSLEGFSAIILAVGSIVGALIYGRTEQRKERENKLRPLPEQAPRPRQNSN